MDVKLVLLNGVLKEEGFVEQPPKERQERQVYELKRIIWVKADTTCLVHVD